MKNLKNLLIYINPNKSFANDTWGESELLVKIQIDNSLGMGWKREDIMLVTNFPYEYDGVKAIVIGDENYYSDSGSTPSKINAIVTLFEKGLIGDELYWFHDFDAFQLEEINLDLDNSKIALTDYGITNINKGRNGRWSTGSIFFRRGSRDVFEWIKEAIYKYQANEEVALLALTRHNKRGILDRIDKLNITYNFATRRRNIVEQYKITDLPIKVIHFHPNDKRPVFYLRTGHDNMDVCVRGMNPWNKPLVTPLLINLFKKYGLI
jgi:hypothetical protein